LSDPLPSPGGPGTQPVDRQVPARPAQTRLSGGLLAVMLALILSLAVLETPSRSAQPDALDFQLLTNPGLELFDSPYAQYEGIDCQVASGWDRFWYDGPAPYWMDSFVFAYSHLGSELVEHREGETCQLIFSTEPYTAGLQQQISGLTPGVGYGFNAAMLTIYQSSAPPAQDHTMIKQVGMDPTGGTDPQAPTIIWSETDDHDEGPWVLKLRAAAWAEGPTMTVFIRVISPYDAGPPPFLNISFLDRTILAETAVVTATSPAISTVPTFTVRWDNYEHPAGGEVKKFDVQWLDEAEGVWHEWFTRTTSLQASFVGQRHHAYRFRARALALYVPDYRLVSPYRPEGDTRTYVKGPEVVGRVVSNEGHPVAGATVAISGTGHATGSGAEGRFELKPPPSAAPQTVTVSHPIRLPPAPVYDVTLGLTETVTVTWTLRPPDDVVANGGFEGGLAAWTTLSEQGIAPEVVDGPVHTGHHALALGGTAAVSSTTGVTQTSVLTDAWEPVLSFWYRPVTDDADDRFHVTLTVVTQTAGTTLPVTATHVFTPDLQGGAWQQAWYQAGLPDAALSGRVTVGFHLWNDGDAAVTTVYLDEVSLGSTPGGPHKVYLPCSLRGS
jgi:hypothetical protein